MRSIHSCSLDASFVTPVCPEHPSLQRVECYCSRLLDVIFYESFTHISLKIRELDGILLGIGPVYVVVNPIDREAIGGRQILVDNYRSLVALIDRSSVKFITKESLKNFECNYCLHYKKSGGLTCRFSFPKHRSRISFPYGIQNRGP